jgi:hypothetical protein
MPTHLYCLLPARSELRLPPTIRFLVAGEIGGWAATTAMAALSRDVRDVARATVEHDRVIGAALAQGITPVPVSLADPYTDDEAAGRDIAAHAEDVARALARVRDRVEMTTIISLTESPPPPSGTGRGRAYLEQLRSRAARLGDIADRVTHAARPFAGEPRRRGDGPALSLSHLIPRGGVDEYRNLGLALAGQGYRLVIDGPRAPYSFARFSPQGGILIDGAASAA